MIKTKNTEFHYQVSGTFQAIPVNVDDTLSDDEETIQTAANVKNVNIPRLENRKIFLDTMLKGSSEAIPNENGIKDDKSEPKKNKLEGTDDIDTQLKLKVEKKQHQVEEILKRKKDEEHLKRLKFEENRIREENERMKMAAEEKKKREEEDKKLQQEKESRLRQIEEQQKGKSKVNLNSHGIPERKEENGLQQRNSELDIELPEEKALLREEDKIKTLNEEIFRGHIGPERRSPKPKAVEQYERLVTNKFSNEKCEKENITHMTEKRNT